MTDLQRYLKSEFRDPEFQSYELRRRFRMTGWAWAKGLAALAGLCLFMANFLYWRP